MRSRIPELVNPSGAFDVRPMDAEPLVSPGARWWRFTCDSGSSRALLAIGEHDQLPNDVVVTVSTDLRRLPLVWRLLGDWRLSRVLATTMEESGAQRLTDAGG